MSLICFCSPVFSINCPLTNTFYLAQCNTNHLLTTPEQNDTLTWYFVNNSINFLQETLKQHLKLLTEKRSDLQSQLMDCHLQIEQEGKVRVPFFLCTQQREELQSQSAFGKYISSPKKITISVSKIIIDQVLLNILLKVLFHIPHFLNINAKIAPDFC